MKNKALFLTFFFLFFAAASSFCQSNKTDTTPEPYKEDEFPQGLKDLRRFEIITLGSMPFITLDSAIVYNGYKYATGKADKFNPLATADYSQKEMERIIVTSLCISAGIGVTDYVINLIKRSKKNKKQRLENSNISIEDYPDAVPITLPVEPQETEEFEESEETIETIEISGE